MMKAILGGRIKVRQANTFLTRLKGLLGTSHLANDEGLLIQPCNSVHMLGMRYAIDIVYLDGDGRIIKTVENLYPWTGCSVCLGAQSVVEIAAGMVKAYDLKIGQKII